MFTKAYLLIALAVALAIARAEGEAQIDPALQCTTDLEQSCIFAGAGINVTGKGIASSVAPGPGLPGMVHLIDKAGGSGNITGCQGQATWLFDYTGESKEASFSGKMQQVNGKLSGFFTSNPTMMVTRDEVKSVMKGDDMTVYCAMSSKALGGI